MAGAPWVFTSSSAHAILGQMGIAVIACLSYNILLGQGGMLSFGHAVYTGLGAFGAIHALRLVGDGTLALPVSGVPLVGGLAGLAGAAAFGWLATRKGGTAFAMITLGIGELAWASALMFPGVFGGEGGVTADRTVGGSPWGISLGPSIELVYLIAIYTGACTALMYLFTRTALGRLLNAVRDNAERVAFIGYDPRRIRYLAFMVSAFFAGISGGLAALAFEIVTADAFGAARSGAYLLFTFLGGTGFFVGPLIGGVLMVLAFVLLSEWTRAWLLYVGLAFLAAVMFAPGGVAGLLLDRSSRGGRGWPAARLVRIAGAVLAGAGMAALIELVYHLQLEAMLGPELRFGGLSLHTREASSWWGAALSVLGGAALFRLAGLRLRKRGA
nr:branched-chain amino acid ABC transporter permease [Ramlibacter aurantiacus]